MLPGLDVLILIKPHGPLLKFNLYLSQFTKLSPHIQFKFLQSDTNIPTETMKFSRLLSITISAALSGLAIASPIPVNGDFPTTTMKCIANCMEAAENSCALADAAAAPDGTVSTRCY